MYHSITIGSKNTWDDWHLIPTSRPMFSLPKINAEQVYIPLKGTIDLSEINNKVTYSNRTGSFDFIVVNGYGAWTDRYGELKTYLDGTRKFAELEDDPGFLYDGTFSVGSWRSGKNFSTISVQYSVSPFKIERIGNDEKWLWNLLDLDQGMITDYSNLLVDQQLIVDLPSTYGGIRLSIYSTSSMMLMFNDVGYPINSGYNLTDITLKSEINELEFLGNGIITIGGEGKHLL